MRRHHFVVRIANAIVQIIELRNRRLGRLENGLHLGNGVLGVAINFHAVALFGNARQQFGRFVEQTLLIGEERVNVSLHLSEIQKIIFSFLECAQQRLGVVLLLLHLHQHMHAIFYRLLIGIRVCRHARIVRAQKLLALPDGFRQFAFHAAHPAVFVGGNITRARELRQNVAAILQKPFIQFHAALDLSLRDFAAVA